MLLSDPRLITGLLKEALFSEKPITLEVGSQRFLATLENAVDDSPRVLEAKKVFFLQLVGTSNQLQKQDVTIKIDFSRFSVTFSGAKILSAENSRCEISCPLEAEIFNRRTAERTPFPEKTTTEVTVQSEGVHSKATFTAHDHNVHFIGGFLRALKDQPINESTFVAGRVSIGNSYLDIYAKISTYVMVEENEAHSIYRVSLKNFSENGEDFPAIENSERRRYNRVKVTPPIDLVDPEASQVSYDGLLRDCSLSGFSWKPAKVDEHPCFAIGAVIETKKPKMKVRFLGHRNSDTYAFEIVKASIEDRHIWMDILNESSGLNYKVHQGSEAEKVLALFIESGDLATGYVNNNKGQSAELRNSLHRHAPHFSGLLHRWKLKTADENQIDTLASAFRVSESGWMIGDIAAQIANKTGAGKHARRDFIHSFIESFCKFCETLTPCPEVSILFLESHPFWKKFSEYVLTASVEVHVARVSYFRFVVEAEQSTKFSFQKLHGKDWKKIQGLSHAMLKQNISPGFLDARVDAFGSPLLASLFEKFHFDFERNYYEVDAPVKGFLVINKFSPAITLNQTVNCAWFFPNAKLGTNEVALVRGLAKQLSLKLSSASPGLIIPSEMLVGSDTSKSSLLISGAPSIFGEFFGNLKEAA